MTKQNHAVKRKRQIATVDVNYLEIQINFYSFALL